MPFISILTDKKNVLTKEFSLDEDGNLVKKAPGHLMDGTVESVNADAHKLAGIIHELTPNQCLCLGTVVKPGLHPMKATKLAKPGDHTRTKKHLRFQEEAWMLLDFDFEGDNSISVEDAIKILSEIDPRIKDTDMLATPSSSSHIKYQGQQIIGEGNFHLYVAVKGNVERYGQLLFDHLILNGYGRTMVTRNGTIVIKALFDKSTLSPEREIFAVTPVLKDGLTSERDRKFVINRGAVLDIDDFPDMDDDQHINLRLTKVQLRSQATPESERQRKVYQGQQAERRAKANGTTKALELAQMTTAKQRYDKLGRPVVEILSSDYIMDEDGNEFPIRDLLLEPQEGLRLPDPIDPFIRGDEKAKRPGRGIATVLGGIIFSHAHGGVIHKMVWDPIDLVDTLYEPTIDPEKKKGICQALMLGQQHLAENTTDADINNIAESLKVAMKGLQKTRLPTEKRHTEKKLKPTPQLEDIEEDEVLKFNARYGMADVGGKAVVLAEQWSDDGEMFDVQYYLPASMDVLTKNQHMRLPGQNQVVSMYRYWEQHPDRLTYETIYFEPRPNLFRKPGKMRMMPQTNKYNMFQGYILDPSRATSCQRILDHLRVVWCGNVDIEYEYCLAWLARLFQKPKEVSTTALVLQSVPGVGKSVIIDKIIVKTMGVHAISTANSDDLTGRFNSHLGLNLFFFANELAYTAQASMKSILKTILSDDHRMIEAKNVNKVKARNYTSVIFASNNEWVANIDAGDRRFVYLSVSSSKKGETKYFNELVHEIDNGGREAFILYLLNYDLSKIDLTKIPNRNQKQRRADFLRSTHPSVRSVWMLADPDISLAIYANNTMYKRLQNWKDNGEEMILDYSQFFEVYREFTDYHKIDRKYDDASNLVIQLEAGGLLARETEPGGDKPIERVKVNGQNRLRFKPIAEFRELMKV